MAVASVGDRSLRLLRVDSAVQEKYTDGASTLSLDGSQALPTSDSFVVRAPACRRCTLPVAQPWQPRYAVLPPGPVLR